MALSKRSLSQAKQLLQQILDSNVDVIVTRATLDKKIELVKFPYLKHKHEKIQKNKTIYVSSQYDPIRYWLINNGFLTSSKIERWGVYQYRVNRDTIKAFLQSDSNIEQSNNIKNENKKVMTRKERVFRHIEDNGNAMRYTDIIKFAFEDKYGKGTFDKKKHRGFYACAFTYHSYWSAQSSTRRKNIGSPKGHFVTLTKNGHLIKLSNGLWSVHRPHGWVRSEANCETYETRIEKFLSDGKSVVERDIVSYLKPYIVQHRGKIGYDWGNTNQILKKMIDKGTVVRELDINPKTNRPAYFYSLNCVSTPKVENTSILEDGEYDSMCEVLAKYNVTPDQLDSLATNYYHKKDGDGASCYRWAYYDLLEKSGVISDTTQALQKEIDELADRIIAEEKCVHQSEQKYMVICDDDSVYEGIYSMLELQEFFSDKDPDDYTIIEAGNAIKLEKKVTTTFTIK